MIIPEIISSDSNFWTIKNVFYRNNISKIDLLKTLLENGKSKTQNQWIEYSKQSKINNNFYMGDMPLYHSLFDSLYKLKDKPKTEEIRSFLQTQFKTRWLMTLTKIKYQAKGLDKIINNYKMPDEYLVEEDFVGPSECIKNYHDKKDCKSLFKDYRDKKDCKSLLNSDNVQEINSIYNWITGKDVYLSRLNSRPTKENEKIVRFYAGFSYTELNCVRNQSESGSGIGVRVI